MNAKKLNNDISKASLQADGIATPSGVSRLTRDDWGRLSLTDMNGNRYQDVSPVPLFPVTDPKRWVSLVDSTGQEILCIENMDELAECDIAILQEELTLREFIPRIQRVISVSGNTEPCQWHVDTDRGKASFILKSEEDIRRLNSTVVQIIGSDGVRFRVDNMHALDARSRRFIEWYV